MHWSQIQLSITIAIVSSIIDNYHSFQMISWSPFLLIEKCLSCSPLSVLFIILKYCFVFMKTNFIRLHGSCLRAKWWFEYYLYPLLENWSSHCQQTWRLRRLIRSESFEIVPNKKGKGTHLEALPVYKSNDGFCWLRLFII